jgi:hypothetical protein
MQPRLGLEQEHLLKKNMMDLKVKAYHQKQVDLAVRFGAERSRAEKEMKEVLEFEFELAEVRK